MHNEELEASTSFASIVVMPLVESLSYPVRACASKGLCDQSWRLYIVYI